MVIRGLSATIGECSTLFGRSAGWKPVWITGKRGGVSRCCIMSGSPDYMSRTESEGMLVNKPLANTTIINLRQAHTWRLRYETISKCRNAACCQGTILWAKVDDLAGSICLLLDPWRLWAGRQEVTLPAAQRTYMRARFHVPCRPHGSHISRPRGSHIRRPHGSHIWDCKRC